MRGMRAVRWARRDRHLSLVFIEIISYLYLQMLQLPVIQVWLDINFLKRKREPQLALHHLCFLHFHHVHLKLLQLLLVLRLVLQQTCVLLLSRVQLLKLLVHDTQLLLVFSFNLASLVLGAAFHRVWKQAKNKKKTPPSIKDSRPRRRFTCNGLTFSNGLFSQIFDLLLSNSPFVFLVLN